jgi:isovaleryl-CoA dehydrogenase
MQTKAENKGDHYLLNGTKMWITNAQYSDVAYVYARTGSERKAITTFLVEKGSEGFSVGKPIHKMGMRASPTGELVFENAKVPLENRVGEEGDSIYHMMKNLDIERITISGISLGIARGCLEQCIQYANERQQFGKTIGQYQMIQRMVAEMSSKVDMMTHYLYSACKAYDQGKQGPLVAAHVKLAIPQMVTQIALDAIQLHGGYGYSREFPVERYMRDNKLMEIGAGTNEVMVMIIAKRLLELEGNKGYR